MNGQGRYVATSENCPHAWQNSAQYGFCSIMPFSCNLYMYMAAYGPLKIEQIDYYKHQLQLEMLFSKLPNFRFCNCTRSLSCDLNMLYNTWHESGPQTDPNAWGTKDSLKVTTFHRVSSNILITITAQCNIH